MSSLTRTAFEWSFYQAVGDYYTGTRLGSRVVVDLNTITYLLLHPEYIPKGVSGPIDSLRQRGLSLNELLIVLEWYERKGCGSAGEFALVLEQCGFKGLMSTYPEGSGERIMFEMYKLHAKDLIIGKWAAQLEEQVTKSVRTLEGEMGGRRLDEKVQLKRELNAELERLQSDKGKLRKYSLHDESGCILDVEGWGTMDEVTGKKTTLDEVEAFRCIRKTVTQKEKGIVYFTF